MRRGVVLLDEEAGSLVRQEQQEGGRGREGEGGDEGRGEWRREW